MVKDATSLHVATSVVQPGPCGTNMHEQRIITFMRQVVHAD